MIGEINELQEKEIELSQKDFSIIQKILADNISAKIYDDPKMASLLIDINDHESLTKVQEGKWNELIERLGKILEKELSSYENYTDAGLDNIELIVAFDLDLDLLPLKTTTVFTVNKIKMMYHLYKSLEKS